MTEVVPAIQEGWGRVNLSLMVATKAAALSLFVFLSGALAQIQVNPFLDLPGETSDPAISPDGTSLAFAWWTPNDNDWGIYIRPMSGGAPRLFVKTEDRIAYSPKWSPDGKWIAYLASGTPRTSELFIKPVAGGPERSIGPVCSDGVAWTADSRSIITPNNDDSDSLYSCRLAVVSIEAGGPMWQLAKRGNEPAISGDGKTVAFVKDREIHLIALTNAGRAAGAETTLLRENQPVAHPEWVPGARDIVYQLGRDHSIIRRVEARAGAKPRDDGSIDGEFNGVSFAPHGGPVLAEVESHDDSFLRIDLQSAEPRFEKLRGLPWNVADLTVSPDGQRLLYTRSVRGDSEFFTSNIDGTAPHLLFSVPYERVTRVAWSPDGRQFAFTAEPVVMQISPSHLFLASAFSPAVPRRLLTKFDQTTLVGWSSDGNDLFVEAGSWQDADVSKLRLADNQLTRISGASGWAEERTEGDFIYFERVQLPFSLLRIPAAGGPEEPITNGVLQQFAVVGNDLYFVRQDASPPTKDGLILYHFDLTTKALRPVGKATDFGYQSQFQLSPDKRFIYSEKHASPRRHITIVQNWH